MTEERAITNAIINKIMSAGKPLSEWNVKVHCGIGAGYRKTYVVDDESDEGKYICAVLNSTLARWFALHASPPACSKPMSIKDIPIPQIGEDETRTFAKTVNETLAAKSADPQADTSELEEEIDWLVYDLYDLTDEEISEIADFFWDGEVSEEEEDAAMVRAIEAGHAEGGFVSKEEIMAILRAPSAS